MEIPDSDPRAVTLVKAIRQGKVATLKTLLDTDAGLAHARIVDEKGAQRTLLHIVSDWPGHFPNGPQTVQTLAAAGADLNAAIVRSGTGGSPETPLHWAASSNDVGVLDALLDAGADIEAPGAVFTGGTPMSDAVVFAQWDAARRLLERGAATTIWQAAALGVMDSVQRHLSATPPPSAHDVTNALWHAARGGQLETVRVLADQGADLHWIGHEHKTPLDVARESGSSELIAWLEANGARSVRNPG